MAGVPPGLRVIVFDNERAAAHALAVRIGAELAARPALVLGLPTGRTSVRLYQELATLAREGRADLSHVRTFNLDEFFGIDASHPGSYRGFMQAHLFDPVNIPPEHVGFLNGAAADPAAECARYEEAIRAAGGIDVQILGIGTNGHIGFNEPGPALEARTHRVRLRPETRRSNAALFGGDAEAVPAEALSMGMATILQARAIVLLATGRSKARCVDRVIHGPITTELPGSFLQLHPDVEIVLDRAAASRLEVQEFSQPGLDVLANRLAD